MPRALLFNPPGPRVQRSEDRCQGDVDELAAADLRACNDLGLLAAILRRLGFQPTIRDYPAERGTWADLERDLRDLTPDLALMSITSSTLLDDLHAFELAKAIRPDTLTVAKGAFFSICDVSALTDPRFRFLDVGITGEAEWVLPELLAAYKSPPTAVGGRSNDSPTVNPQSAIRSPQFPSVRGVIYWRAGRLVRTPDADFHRDLDALPFPARDLMPNHLYLRPDTGHPMATIQTGRGCPCQCIFCPAPIVSGKVLRQRSPANIVDEVEECVTRYGIRDFFFRADTFTLDRRFVIAVCEDILRRGLEVEWVANSRVKPLDAEELDWMRRAGCWLVALGIEFGSDEALARTRKQTTLDDARRAVALCREAGIKTLGYYLIGLPWETRADIDQTIRFGRELDCDFVEVHIVTPFEGTELWTLSRDAGLLRGSTLGSDYLTRPAAGTLHLTASDLIALRRRALRALYLNPSHIARLVLGVRSPAQFANYFRYGLRLVRRVLRRGR